MDPRNIILPAIFLGLVSIFLPLVYRVLRRHNERMRRVAEDLGFTYQGAIEETPGAAKATGLRRWLQISLPWRLTGTQDGVAVAIYLEKQGSSKNKNVYSIVEASFPRPLPFILRVGRQTALARLGKAIFGIRDIEVGSERFDSEVRIKGSEPDHIRRLLSNSAVQERILVAIKGSPTFTMTEQAARWEKMGAVEKAEIYRQAIGLVVPVVRALKETHAFGQADPARNGHHF